MRICITYSRVANAYVPICTCMTVKDILIPYFRDVRSYHFNKLNSLKLLSQNGGCLFPIIIV